MRVFLGKRFDKWAVSEDIAESELWAVAAEAFAGAVEADLGGYLFKKRIARQGGGNSGGYRTILGFRKDNSDRIFFLYGFPKNARATITQAEKVALSLVARNLVQVSDQQIEALKEKRTLREISQSKASERT